MGNFLLSEPDEEDVVIGRRLRQAIDGKGLLLKDAAAIAGVATKTLQRWLSGSSSADVKGVSRLAAALGIPTDRLIAGIGGESGDWETHRHEDLFDIPLHDIAVSAGHGAAEITAGAADVSWGFPRAWLAQEFGNVDGLRIVRIKGDSQEPDLRDGDWLMIDVHRKDLRDGMYVVRLDDHLMVKRLQVQGHIIRLTSANPAYHAIPVDLQAEAHRFEVIGRAVWTGKKLGG